MHIQTFMWAFHLGGFLELELLGSWGRFIFNFYRKLTNAKSSPKYLCHLTLPPTMYENSLFYFLTNICYCQSFILAIVMTVKW